MKLFKNKFFIICLAVAVGVAVLMSVFSLMGYRALVRNVLGTVATPFRLIGKGFCGAVEGFGKYFGSVDTLREKNTALEDENRALREQIERAERLEAENARLREYLGMKSAYPNFTFEEGTVIGREGENHLTLLTLNRGSIHGIRVNMAVITKDGIVGCVSEVGLTWCKVSTILENARSVGVLTPRTGAAGILAGDYTYRESGTCRLTFLEGDTHSAEAEVGDRVETSGLGSIYPAGLKVGEVTAVTADAASRSVIATVKPAVDFSALDYVMIITAYQEKG